MSVTGGTPPTAVYTAPTGVPVGADAGATTATLTYTVNNVPSTYDIDVATAFVGPPAILPVATVNANTFLTVPFERRFAASGSNVYAAFIDSAGMAIDVFASTDNGKTFVGTTYPTGQGSFGSAGGSATVAVDPGNPAVVYLAYTTTLPNDNGNGITVRLAVSTDGAKTFPHEYVIAESGNFGTFPGYATPDVVSPSPGHVIVTTIGFVNANSMVDEGAEVFASGNQGANIGPESFGGGVGDAGLPLYGGTNRNLAPPYCNRIDGDTGGPIGARVFSNGQGSACIVYRVDTPSMNCLPSGGIIVQCSTDSGMTWSAPTTVTQPAGNTNVLVTGAMSPSGNIALTWMDATTLGGTGPQTEVWLATSTVAAQVLGQPFKTFQYPTASRVAAAGTINAATSLPTVQWQSDHVLWLSQTVSTGGFVLVDKTCDDGATWSGWVNAGPYTGSSLFVTTTPNVGPVPTTGMALGGSSKGPNQILDVSLAFGQGPSKTP